MTASTTRAFHTSNPATYSEDALHRLLRNVPGMVFRGSADAARTMELVSHGSRDLIGFGPNDLTGSRRLVSYGTLIHADDRQRVQETLARAVLSGRPYQVEYRVRRVDGRERLVREIGQPVPGERGSVLLEGFVTDVLGSDHSSAGDAGADQRFRTLVEQSQVGLYVIREQRFEYVNSRLAQVFGYQEEEILALPSVQEVVHPEDRESIAENLRMRLEGKEEDVPYEFRGQTKDGRQRNVEALGRRVDLDGTPVLAGTLLDVTERRRGERRVRESQKIEALGRLASGVAHDLNNVLATIKGTAQVLVLERPEDQQLANDIAQIISAVDRGSLLGRQLMSVGRPRRSSDEVVALGPLISNLAPALQRTLGDQIELRLVLDPSAPHARIDSAHVEDMLMILTMRGRDAMPDGGTLTIRTQRVSAESVGLAPGAYVALEVTDTGLTPSAEALARAFEPAFSTSGPLVDLAHVWRMANDAGGTAEVEAGPGRGATFRVTLPAALTH